MLNAMTRRMGMGLRMGMIVAICGASMGFVLPAGASPQPASNFWGNPSEPSIVSAPPTEDDASVSFDFAGGTLSQYIETIRAAAQPKAYNLIASGTGPEPILPRCAMQGVSMSMAATVASQIAKGVKLSIVMGQSGTSPVYAYTYAVDEKETSRVSTEILSLRKVLDRLPTDSADQRIAYDSQTVLSALESAAMMAEEETAAPVRIRFHTESSLLFVRGTREQLVAVMSALNLLEKDVEARRVSRGGGDLRRMQNDIEQMELELTFAEEQLRSAINEHELLQTRYKEGMVSQSEVAAVEQKKLAKQAQFDMLKLRLEQSRVELKLYRPEAKTEAKPEAPKTGK